MNVLASIIIIITRHEWRLNTVGIDEMLNTITTKDELIKWLINERYIYLRKVSGEIVADNETEMIVDKYNSLKDKED